MYKYLKLYSICALFLFAMSCEDLPILEDCNVRVEFTHQIVDSLCIKPCAVQITNLSENADSYLWSFGDGNNSEESGNTFVHEYDSAGLYTITLTAFLDGCPSQEFQIRDIPVGVSNPPVPLFTVSSNFCTLIKEDCTIEFNNISEFASSYEWYFNDVLMPDLPDDTFSHTFTEPDTVIVKLVAINSEGERREVSKEIIIRPLTFEVKTHEVDNDPGEDDAVFGVVEIGNNEGYSFMAANDDNIYVASTDIFGENLDASSGRSPDIPFNSLSPNAFFATSTGYVLTGKISKSGGDSDIFIAKTNLAFNHQSLVVKDYAEPFASGKENAFGGTEYNGDYLVCGKGKIGDDEGVYLLQVRQNLNKDTSYHLFDSDEVAEAKAVLAVPGGIWLGGLKKNDAGEYITFFAEIEDGFSTNNVIITPIGSEFFEIEKIIQLNSNTAVVIGNENGVGIAVMLTVGSSNRDLFKDYPNFLIRDGILTDDGRLIFVGTRSDLPVWFEVNTISLVNKNNSRSYGQDIIEEGDAFCIAPTADGGFIIGGRGNTASSEEMSILIKTDRNGEVDPQ